MHGHGHVRTGSELFSVVRELALCNCLHMLQLWPLPEMYVICCHAPVRGQPSAQARKLHSTSLCACFTTAAAAAIATGSETLL